MRTLHVGLRIADVERSVAFYTVLGQEVLGVVRTADSVSLTMLKLPDDEFVSLELVRDPAHGTVDPSGLSHIVVNVDNLERTVTDLAARGVETEAPTSHDSSHELRTAWLTDPDGFRIELVQWPKGHPTE